MKQGQIIFSEQQIQERVKQLAQQIQRDYQGKQLHMVGVLKGGAVFLADLMRQINVPVTIDFFSLSSYGQSTHSSGNFKIDKVLSQPVEDKHILIVEDITDTGRTVEFLKNNITGALSVRVAAFLDKPSRRKTNVVAEYIGYQVDDIFVVGYGMDCGEQFRNLPYICVCEP